MENAASPFHAEPKHVEGHMDKSDDSSFVVTDSDRENIATVYFGKCTLMYHRAEDYFDPKKAKNYDDCILVSLDTNDAHANVVVLSARTRKSSLPFPSRWYNSGRQVDLQLTLPFRLLLWGRLRVPKPLELDPAGRRCYCGGIVLGADAVPFA